MITNHLKFDWAAHLLLGADAADRGVPVTRAHTRQLLPGPDLNMVTVSNSVSCFVSWKLYHFSSASTCLTAERPGRPLCPLTSIHLNFTWKKYISMTIFSIYQTNNCIEYFFVFTKCHLHSYTLPWGSRYHSSGWSSQSSGTQSFSPSS